MLIRKKNTNPNKTHCHESLWQKNHKYSAATPAGRLKFVKQPLFSKLSVRSLTALTVAIAAALLIGGATSVVAQNSVSSIPQKPTLSAFFHQTDQSFGGELSQAQIDALEAAVTVINEKDETTLEERDNEIAAINGNPFFTAAGKLERIADLKADKLTQEEKAEQTKAAIEAEIPGSAGATCSEQLTQLSLGLAEAGLGTGIVGTVAEAAGSIFGLFGSEAPGIIIQGVGHGISLGSVITDRVASDLPSCNAEFTGTIVAHANISANMGISAHNGAITLGDADGVTYFDGITLGGGSLSGAGGSANLDATTNDATAIAIGNGANAGGVNSTTFGTGANAVGVNATALGANANAVA